MTPAIAANANPRFKRKSVWLKLKDAYVHGKRVTLSVKDVYELCQATWVENAFEQAEAESPKD